MPLAWKNAKLLYNISQDQIFLILGFKCLNVTSVEECKLLYNISQDQTFSILGFRCLNVTEENPTWTNTDNYHASETKYAACLYFRRDQLTTVLLFQNNWPLTMYYRKLNELPFNENYFLSVINILKNIYVKSSSKEATFLIRTLCLHPLYTANM